MRIHTHTLTGSDTQCMHALSLQASQVADIFHFCAYKVIIIILVGVTEQGSIHCDCQPPINIPLLRGNPRSSRDLQFTQLRSMWTKKPFYSLSFPLFFPPSPFPPIPALHFPITSPLGLATVHLTFLLSVFCLPLSPVTCLPPPWCLAPISISHVTSHLFPLKLSSLSLFSPVWPPLIDTVVTHRTEFSRLLLESVESDEVRLIAGGSHL